MKLQLDIVIFDGDLHPSTFVYRLAEGLSKSHRVSIMGFTGNPRPSIPNLSYVCLGSASQFPSLVLKSIGWSLKYFTKKGSLKPFLWAIKNILWLRKVNLQQQNLHLALSLLQPDIVHVQWPSLLPWCEEILSKQRYKVVLSQRGYQINVRPIIDPENLAYLQRWFPKIAGFHSVSRAISKVGDTFWNSPDKIDQVVYSGFNFDDISFQSHYQKKTPLKLLSVGRPHWVKGYATALKACEILQKKNIPFQYKIIGAANDEELLVLIDSYQLSDSVELLPKYPQTAVYELMMQHDALLFPSYSEGLPNVVVEAMAVGLPVIATNCGGMPEIWKDAWGTLVTPYDAEAFAATILAFFHKDLKTIETQRQEARTLVLQQHSVEKMVSDMDKLYRKVLGKK